MGQEIKVGQSYEWAGWKLIVTKIEPPLVHYVWNEQYAVPSTGKARLEYIQTLPRVYHFNDYYLQIDKIND